MSIQKGRPLRSKEVFVLQGDLRLQNKEKMKRDMIAVLEYLKDGYREECMDLFFVAPWAEDKKQGMKAH